MFKKVVLPFLGLAVILAFTLGGLFFGFASYKVDCIRKSAGQLPNCQIQETRLLGLYNRNETVLNVSNVGYKAQDVNTSSKVTLAGTVYFYGESGAIPVSSAVSNVGDAWKADVINQSKAFLDNANQLSFSITKSEKNIFGWIGLAIGALLILSCLSWGVKKLK